MEEHKVELPKHLQIGGLINAFEQPDSNSACTIETLYKAKEILEGNIGANVEEVKVDA